MSTKSVEYTATGLRGAVLGAVILIIAITARYVGRAVVSHKTKDRPEGIQVLVNNDEAELDIVAVHGLGAHPVYTWTSPARTTLSSSSAEIDVDPSRKINHRVNWLRDDGFLKSDFQQARIMTFCYDATWLVDAPMATAEQRATMLLRTLERRRRGQEARPILFIGHSFGGIIIKYALCQAEVQGDFRNILKNTRGILFLGTPHQGSSTSSWVADIASVFSIIPLLGSNAIFLKLLRSNSPQLSNLRDQFSAMIARSSAQSRTPQLYSIIETKKTYVCGMIPLGLVVGRDSGTIESGNIPIEMDRDHSGLNKCSSNKDRLYEEIVDIIRKVLEFSKQRASKAASMHSENERAGCLRALAEFASNPRQNDDNIRNAVRGTGAQALEQPACQSWMNSPRSDVLWLVGKAGTGKSTLLCEVLYQIQNRAAIPSLDDMLSLEGEPDDAQTLNRNTDSPPAKRLVASYFYNFRERYETSNANMMQSLLYQLLYQDKNLFDAFRDVYKSYKSQASSHTAWKIEDLAKIFRNILSLQGARLHIELFIDALDESDEAEQMFDIITGMQHEVEGSKVVMKIAVTCRDMHPLIQVPDDRKIHLESHNAKEIQELIEWRIRDIEQRLKHFSDRELMARNVKKVSEFKKEVQRKAQGVILWVSLALATVTRLVVQGKFTVDLMMSTLDSLPDQLDTLYSHIVDKLKYGMGHNEILEIRYWLQ